FSDPGPVFHTIVSIKNDGHYFCRAGGNRPDGLNEPVTVYAPDGMNVNQFMVRAGAAWVYEQYNTDPVLPVLQNEARQQKRGLWSDADPVPPWIWRHRK
ncbi:thermonuclease family protein, partial [Escherichia coli]|uniref:thermonuclease family protein n=1 Tax=Escherichia coli TaxID=562 RepID=UPI002876A020